jgi:hypothetical protein
MLDRCHDISRLMSIFDWQTTNIILVETTIYSFTIRMMYCRIFYLINDDNKQIDVLHVFECHTLAYQVCTKRTIDES